MKTSKVDDTFTKHHDNDNLLGDDEKQPDEKDKDENHSLIELEAKSDRTNDNPQDKDTRKDGDI